MGGRRWRHTVAGVALLAAAALEADGAGAAVELQPVPPGGTPHVRTFTYSGGIARPGPGFLAYDAGFGGGVHVASGDVDGDGIDEIVTGPNHGGGAHVQLFTLGGAARIGGFFAHDPAFTGGIDVAVADVDGDGRAEIVTGAGRGGGPHVQVFSVNPATGAARAVASFMAYDPSFTGGINVSAGDVDGDGDAEIVTAPLHGGGPHVRVFDAGGRAAGGGFLAYPPDFLGGVDVAAADLDGDGRAEIVTGAGPGGGPHVRVLTGAGGDAGREMSSFFAFDPAFTGGVRVVAGDVQSDAAREIVVGAGFGGGPHVRTFRADGSPSGNGFLAYDPAYRGGVDVAASPARGVIVTGAGGAQALAPVERPRGNRPVVYLTFDDGPSPYTAQVLDVLRRYGATATFFAVGSNVAARPQVTAAALDAGHHVANHTWRHEYLTRLTHAQFTNTVTATQNAIGPRGSRCLRPPYGAVNAQVQSWSRGLGYPLVMWTIDTKDYRRPGASAIAQAVLSRATNGSVVLMHDGGGDRSQTVAALPHIITTLQARGFALEAMC